ncbi:hypothetical protein LUZ60_017252 [Juncus effusus]|nr:hypothetical protein LUZ60_017252 [Juncus effusus]
MCPISAGKTSSNNVHKRRKLIRNSFLTPIEEDSKEKITTKDSKCDALIENTSKCSTSNIVNHEEPLINRKPSREVCIQVLISHGLLFNDEKENNTRHDSTSYDREETKIHLLKCKSCGSNGRSDKMLICDFCEGPYHRTCSGVLTRNIPFGKDWYCHPCIRNKPKGSIQKLNPNGAKLNSVRIGEDYQVEVEEWASPIYEDDDYWNDPLEIDPSEFIEVLSKVEKYHNWLQCKAEIKKGVVCGKWRRAPYYLVQTKTWDCSIAVQWDPAHADCPVPQELETSEVVKELERVKLLRHKFADRERSRMNSNHEGQS